jgi:hypothetical protein
MPEAGAATAPAFPAPQAAPPSCRARGRPCQRRGEECEYCAQAHDAARRPLAQLPALTPGGNIAQLLTRTFPPIAVRRIESAGGAQLQARELQPSGSAIR